MDKSTSQNKADRALTVTEDKVIDLLMHMATREEVSATRLELKQDIHNSENKIEVKIDSLREELKQDDKHLRLELKQDNKELREELVQTRLELKQDNKELREELVQTRLELKQDNKELREELKEDNKQLKNLIVTMMVLVIGSIVAPLILKFF